MYLAWTQMSSKEVVFVLAPGLLSRWRNLVTKKKPKKDSKLSYNDDEAKLDNIKCRRRHVLGHSHYPRLIQESFPRERSKI